MGRIQEYPRREIRVKRAADCQFQFLFRADGQPHFTREGIEKDRIRSQWLNSQGIEVIRFTSHEIENETQRVLFAIDVVLKKRLKPGAPPHPPTPSPPEEEKGS